MTGVQGVSANITSAEAFNIDNSQGYTLSVKMKDSKHLYECLRFVAEKRNMSIFEKVDIGFSQAITPSSHNFLV